MYRFTSSMHIPGFPMGFEAGDEVEESAIHPSYRAGWIEAGILVPAEDSAQPKPAAHGKSGPSLDSKGEPHLDIQSASVPAKPADQ